MYRKSIGKVSEKYRKVSKSIGKVSEKYLNITIIFNLLLY